MSSGSLSNRRTRFSDGATSRVRYVSTKAGQPLPGSGGILPRLSQNREIGIGVLPGGEEGLEAGARGSQVPGALPRLGETEPGERQIGGIRVDEAGAQETLELVSGLTATAQGKERPAAVPDGDELRVRPEVVRPHTLQELHGPFRIPSRQFEHRAYRGKGDALEPRVVGRRGGSGPGQRPRSAGLAERRRWPSELPPRRPTTRG